MKRTAILAVLISTGGMLSLLPAAQTASLLQVHDNLYLIQSDTTGANTTFLVTDEDVVVVDPPATR